MNDLCVARRQTTHTIRLQRVAKYLQVHSSLHSGSFPNRATIVRGLHRTARDPVRPRNQGGNIH